LFQEIAMTHESDIQPSDAAHRDDIDHALRHDVEVCEWERQAAAQAKLEAELFELNKAKLIDALAAAGVAEVVVDFDGYGDSGQIEDIHVRSGGEEIDMPEGDVEHSEALWGKPEPERSLIGFGLAVERLAYRVLEQTHDGWENDEGAYGDVIFNVAERSITLRYNERYTAYENYAHTF
jgi:hypothetical protein